MSFPGYGAPVDAPVEGVKSLREPRPTSSAKAVREPGATFRPFKETLRDEVGWFARHMPDLVGPAASRLAAMGQA